MNKAELIKNIAGILKDNGTRKPVYTPKKVFHISDDEGNSKDFIMHVTGKTVAYTSEDVENILNAFTEAVSEALKRGDTVSVRSFGTFCLRYHKGRTVKIPGTDNTMSIPSEYYPRFTPAKDLKMSARLYGQMLEARDYDDSETFEDLGDDYGD